MWDTFMQSLSGTVATLVEPMALRRSYRRFILLTAPVSFPLLVLVATILAALLAALSLIESYIYELRTDGIADLWNGFSLRELIE